MNAILQMFFKWPTRAWLFIVAMACIAMMAFGVLYFQYYLGTEPCPICIVQR